MNEEKTLVTKKQILENPIYPFSKGQIDYFFTNRHKNGLESAVRKIGKRVYIRLDIFNSWIEKQSKEEV